MARAARGASRSDRLTLEQVASAAGVSKAAASYAINGRPGVAEETRQQVLAVATELGYETSGGGSMAGTAGAATISAVLAPEVDDPGAPNYYASALLAGAEEEARIQGFRLQVRVSDGQAPLTVEDHLAGLLYLGGTFSTEMLAETPTPAVLVGTTAPQWPHDAVLADNSRGAYLATAQLLAKGRSRVAFINGPPTTRTSELKLFGYREALTEAGLVVDEQLVTAANFSVESGYQAVMDLYERTPQPRLDALFVADDYIAIGAMQAFADRDIAVPADVAVVGYGDTEASSATRPMLSTVRVFQRRMGALGARTLLDRVNGRLHESITILVGPEVLARDTH